MISRCRAKTWIVQLQENAGSAASIAQRGLRGHIIMFPQEPERVMDVLPRSIENATTPICVIFVGSSPPSKEWLLKHARPLVVRKERIFSALTWLHLHNPYYKDVRLDHSALESLEGEDILPVHVEVVSPSPASESLTARYDIDSSVVDSNVSCNDRIDVFESIVVTGVDPSGPPHVLRAAAMDHVMRQGKGYIQFPHGAQPVGDINNPSFFPLIYPTLFPYGIGAPEDFRRVRRVSLRLLLKDRSPEV
ncbi:hypothetical protein EV363DRAFT_1405140 [Boletus edulis]|nr:hypothetical protein EV363DRAFT_1405140 [Boletus edulis]